MHVNHPVRRSRASRLAAASIAVLLLFAACGDDGGGGDSGGGDGQETDLKVALVLPGPANDQGFNQSAYAGLQKVEEDYGAEIAYSENTGPDDMDRVFNDYASQGFDIVIGAGGQFGEVVERVGPEYPDAHFFVLKADPLQGENYAGYQTLTKDAAYLAGYVAGKTTKTDRMTAIGGFDFSSIVSHFEGFKQGACAANPDVEVNEVFVGSFEDAALGTETAKAEIEAGSDVITHNADAPGVAALQTAGEEGVLGVGWPLDQSIVSEAVFISIIDDQGGLLQMAVKSVVDGTFEPNSPTKEFGLDSEVLGLAGVENLDPALQEEVAALEEQIISGELEVAFEPKPTPPTCS